MSRNEKKMVEFLSVLADANLTNFGYYDPWFTWERGNLSKISIRERLIEEFQMMLG